MLALEAQFNLGLGGFEKLPVDEQSRLLGFWAAQRTLLRETIADAIREGLAGAGGGGGRGGPRRPARGRPGRRRG